MPRYGETQAYQRTDGGYWFEKGVKTISHLFTDNKFRSFAEFQRDFGLPHTAYFQYLQIRHTAAAKFGLQKIGDANFPTGKLTD